MAECDRFSAVSLQQGTGGATELLQQEWNDDQIGVKLLKKYKHFWVSVCSFWKILKP